MARTIMLAGMAGLLVVLAAGQKPAPADPQQTTKPAVESPIRVCEPADRRAEQCPVLRATLPEVRFSSQPLHQVFEFLAELEDVNIVVDWRALGKAGVQRDAPVSCDLRDVSFEDCLRIILDQVRPEKDSLEYDCAGSLIRISMAGELRLPYVMRIYDVRQLIRGIERWDHERTRTRIHLASEAARTLPLRAAPAKGQHDENGHSCLVGSESILETILEADPDETLLDVLWHSVTPDDWIVNGGSSSMLPAGGQLIVHAPLRVHAELQGVLEAMQQSLAQSEE